MRALCTLLIFLLASPALAQNRLAQEPSLFLQQHADNPINWYPWGPEALQKARDEGKLIYVSIGYSSCHWCHVMEEENFTNNEVAAIMNDNFVAIMIDREQRPDLDEQFILVTSMLTGSSGWPNGVFLTPEGDPFFGSGYMPRPDFIKLLTTVVQVWNEDPPAMRAEAFTISQNLRAYLDQAAEAGEITQDDILDITRNMLTDFDEFNGGFGTAPKFPQEQVLLLMLDQAERSGDTDLLEAAVTMLHGMVRGGINDHVGGGFHRYSVDPEWHVPHFEKMLYNQALISRALLRAYTLTGDETFARTAARTLDFVLRDLQAPTGGFYAALDADSLDPNDRLEEGAFYSWTPAQIRAALPAETADSFMAAFDVTDRGPLNGASVLHLQTSPQEAADEMGLTVAQLDTLLATLRQARENRPQPIRDDKIVLAWNGEMIATLAEAGRVLHRADYSRAAVRATQFIQQNMWPAKGLQRVSFNGQIGPDAQLADYAAFGRALLTLYDFDGALDAKNAKSWLAEANRLAQEMQARFSDAGLPMRMRETPAALGPFRPLDDNEIASGNALALMFVNGLDRRTGQNPPRALPLAAALAGPALVQPMQRAGLLLALAAEQGGTTGPVRYAPGGSVRLSLLRNDALKLDLKPGWHINAHVPLDENLIATDITVNGTPLPASTYPEPVVRKLGFSPDPLALYETSTTLPLPTRASAGETKTEITLQACNDQICLAPDDILFRRW